MHQQGPETSYHVTTPPLEVHMISVNISAMQVRDCLLALPQKKWVFTNCNEKHAHLALQTLQIDVRP